MTDEVFTDKRLLGALDYIDERFIAEVTESYTFEAPGEYMRDKKTLFRAYRRLAALAACLLLISAAIPVLNYAVQVFGTGIWEGNAGAGNETFDSPYERAIDAYPEGMSAAEIYADVLKGGWVVNTDGEIIDGNKYWEDFLRQTKNKTKASVLIALYYEENREAIFLKSVSYNGEVYNCDTRYICQPESKDRISSFSAKYLVCHDMTSPTYAEKRNWDPPTKFVWFLTDYPEIPYIEQLIVYESEHYEFLRDNYPTFQSLIWLNDDSEITEAEVIDSDFDKYLESFANISEFEGEPLKDQYEYTPSIGSIDQLSEVGVTIGDVTVEAQKHVSAVYSCIGKDEATGEFIYSTLGEGIINFDKGIPEGCPVLRASLYAEITVTTENLGFYMSLYDMSGKNNKNGIEGTTIFIPSAPGLYYLNIFVNVDHPWINDEIVPTVGSKYVTQYRYLVAIVVE